MPLIHWHDGMLSVHDLYNHQILDHLTVGSKVIGTCGTLKILGCQKCVPDGLPVQRTCPLNRICQKINGIIRLGRVLVIALLVDLLILFVKGLDLLILVCLCKSSG